VIDLVDHGRANPQGLHRVGQGRVGIGEEHILQAELHIHRRQARQAPLATGVQAEGVGARCLELLQGGGHLVEGGIDHPKPPGPGREEAADGGRREPGAVFVEDVGLPGVVQGIDRLHAGLPQGPGLDGRQGLPLHGHLTHRITEGRDGRRGGDAQGLHRHLLE
jgi:hypothetical protein